MAGEKIVADNTRPTTLYCTPKILARESKRDDLSRLKKSLTFGGHFNIHSFSKLTIERQY